VKKYNYPHHSAFKEAKQQTWGQRYGFFIFLAIVGQFFWKKHSCQIKIPPFEGF